MKRIVIIMTLAVFFCGCCCHKKCAKPDQAQQSKVEAQKALKEMDKEKEKDADK